MRNVYSKTFYYFEMKIFLYLFLLVFLIALSGFALGHQIDISIERQDIMLCNSAKISGNVQYLHKCHCYYLTEDIKCLQK